MREVKPTQKPVPSSDIKDLFFNSGLLDIWATSLERKYIDRFGNCHLTAAGMEWLFKELVETFKVDMNAAIVAAGYITIDSFQQGADLPNNELTQRNHILRDETTGEYYRWDGDLPKQVPAGSTPQSTGGIGKGAWVSVGDASLRSDLATDGGKLIYINGKQSLDDYTSDMPSFERWGNADALDNTAALYTALAWMKTRGVGHLYFPRKYRFTDTIPLETGISYNGNGKSTSGLVIAHNEDALKVMSGVKYSPEVNNLIIQHESLNSPSTGIYGVNGNQMRLSNVQVTGFKRGVVTGGASYYSNFDRVRVLNCDEGFVFDSGSRGITATDCSTDAKLNSFILNAETDSINNILLVNPKSEKIISNGVGFFIRSVNSNTIIGLTVISGRFDPESSGSGQVFIKTESQNSSDISNIMFIDPTTFNTNIENFLVGTGAFDQVTVLGNAIGYGHIKATGMFVHDVNNLTRAARLRFIHSDTRPRLEIRNRQDTLFQGIRAGNVEANGVAYVNNKSSAKEACISVEESSWEKPFKLGSWYMWFSSTGVFRKKNGVPLSDGDGTPIHQ